MTLYQSTGGKKSKELIQENHKKTDESKIEIFSGKKGRCIHLQTLKAVKG